MEFNEKIKRLREDLGLTLEQVGNAVGVGKSTVRKWETGDIANMRRDKIAKLADALHTTPGYLMGWETDPDAIQSLLSSMADSGKAGCFEAEDAMYKAFGTEREKLGIRIVGDKTAVLFYKAYATRDVAGLVMDIINDVRGLSEDDLLAVSGMLNGFVNRKSRLEE